MKRTKATKAAGTDKRKAKPKKEGGQPGNANVTLKEADGAGLMFAGLWIAPLIH